jgi:protoheme IX farnesyltransferase
VSATVVPVARGAAADYVELVKPRITLMVMLTALVGFVMASPGAPSARGLLAVVIGTGLVAAGASALNMVLERRTDGLMHRTRTRPLPAGRLRPLDAVAWGGALTATGVVFLAWASGPVAALVALATWSSYLFLYTPLKTRTSLATVVGALPGALPPVIGWAAARGTIDPPAFLLFAILFLWQIPHFLAIAWIYREDYARGGLPMLPVVDPAGVVTGRQAVANSLALTVVSVVPALAGMAGALYLGGAIALGLLLTGAAVRAAVSWTPATARGLFVASLLYLSLLCTLLVVDRV